MAESSGSILDFEVFMSIIGQVILYETSSAGKFSFSSSGLAIDSQKKKYGNIHTYITEF